MLPRFILFYFFLGSKLHFAFAILYYIISHFLCDHINNNIFSFCVLRAREARGLLLCSSLKQNNGLFSFKVKILIELQFLNSRKIFYSFYKANRHSKQTFSSNYVKRKKICIFNYNCGIIISII